MAASGKVTYVDQVARTGNSSWHNGFGMDGARGTFVTETENGKFTATVGSPVPHVLFHITRFSGDIDLALCAKDDQERPIKTEAAYNDEMQLWALKMADDAKSFTLTVTVQKMRSIEFLIAPPQPIKPKNGLAIRCVCSSGFSRGHRLKAELRARMTD